MRVDPLQLGENLDHRLLKDLELLLSLSSIGSPDIATLRSQMHSAETIAILSSVSAGETFFHAILKVMQQRGSDLARVFFGENTPQPLRASGPLVATDGTHYLVVIFRQEIDPSRPSGPLDDPPSIPESLLTVVLETDLKRFSFRQAGTKASVEEPFLELSQEEVAKEVAFLGSLWASIFPEHRSILTRTTSFVIPKAEKGDLFGSRQRERRTWKLKFSRANSRSFQEEQAALERLGRVFAGSHPPEQSLRLMTIEDVRKRLVERGTNAPTVVSESVQGEYVVRRYSPPHSVILKFEESASRRAPSRRDYVLSYRLGSSPREFHRDFLISPDSWMPEDLELYRAVFDIQHSLAIRRSGLFKLGFAQRVYTLLLPPGVLRNMSTPDRGYLLVPCIILYRVPRWGTFRRTFTLTFILIPISLHQPIQKGADSGPAHAGQARRASIDEIRALKNDLKAPIPNDGIPHSGPSVRIGGPLADVLGLPPNPLSVPDLVHRVSMYVASCALDEGNASAPRGAVVVSAGRSESRSAETIAFASSLESRVASALLQVEWRAAPGEFHPWEKWLRTGDDKVLRDNVFKLLFYEDFLAPRSGYTSRRTVDLKAMHVGNTLGADMSGMTFFDPTDDLKLIVYPRQRERYPDYSIVRWMAFSIYTDSALSSLQGMIQRFYNDLDRQWDLRDIVETLDDMIQNFVELYDLDIRLYFYRREYEKLRELLRVDRNYELLLSKFSSVKEDASLREQRLFNKLLLAFTVSTVSTGILSTLATIDQWGNWAYLTESIPAAIGLTLLAYVAFDPVRRFLARFM